MAEPPPKKQTLQQATLTWSSVLSVSRKDGASSPSAASSSASTTASPHAVAPTATSVQSKSDGKKIKRNVPLWYDCTQCLVLWHRLWHIPSQTLDQP